MSIGLFSSLRLHLKPWFWNSVKSKTCPTFHLILHCLYTLQIRFHSKNINLRIPVLKNHAPYCYLLYSRINGLSIWDTGDPACNWNSIKPFTALPPGPPGFFVSYDLTWNTPNTMQGNGLRYPNELVLLILYCHMHIKKCCNKNTWVLL